MHNFVRFTNSAVLLVLRNGKITGADVGGGLYVGVYSPEESGIAGNITASMPPNGTTITGVQVGSNGYSFSMPFKIGFEQIDQGYITLNTPNGQTNAAIRKLQEVP